MLTLMFSLAIGAQSASKLYDEGKALYDAKDYAKAIVKLKAAAEKGHKKAQYRLGFCYDKGKGVKENDALAFQWYSKSAAQGYSKAQYQLGKCYKDGEGTTKDRAKAIELFTKAANQGNANAQYQLGKAYMKGKDSLLKKAINNEKDGKEILQEIRKKAAEGDEDDKQILVLIKK